MFIFLIPIGGGSGEPLLNKKQAIALGILLLFFLISAIGIIIGISADQSKQHHVGEQICEQCQSQNTEGYYTFWNDDGTSAQSEKDADYTIMHCNDCGYTWRYKLKNN